jgi:hypothetical protein
LKIKTRKNEEYYKKELENLKKMIKEIKNPNSRNPIDE